MLGVPRTAAAAASPVIDSPLLDTESTFESQYSNDFAAITQRLQQLEIDYRQLHEELRAMQLGPKVQSALDELEPPSSQRQTSGILATQPSSAAASPPPSRPTASLVADSNVLNVTLSTINQPSKRSGPVDPIGQSSFDCNLSENFSAMRLLADSKETSQKSGFSYRSHSFFTAETSPGRSLMADQLAHESLANYRSFPSRMFDVTALGDVVPDGVNNDQDPLLPTPYSCTSCTRQSASRYFQPSCPGKSTRSLIRAKKLPQIPQKVAKPILGGPAVHDSRSDGQPRLGPRPVLPWLQASAAGNRHQGPAYTDAGLRHSSHLPERNAKLVMSRPTRQPSRGTQRRSISRHATRSTIRSWVLSKLAIFSMTKRVKSFKDGQLFTSNKNNRKPIPFGPSSKRTGGPDPHSHANSPLAHNHQHGERQGRTNQAELPARESSLPLPSSWRMFQCYALATERKVRLVEVKHRLSSLVENGIFVLFQDIYLRPTEKPLFKQRTLAIRPDTESSGSLALPLINPPTPPTMYVWLGSKVSPLQRSDAISALLDFRSFHFAVAPAFILLDSHTCGPAKQEMYALLQPK